MPRFIPKTLSTPQSRQGCCSRAGPRNKVSAIASVRRLRAHSSPAEEKCPMQGEGKHCSGRIAAIDAFISPAGVRARS